MGLFKNKKQIDIYAPFAGTLIPLEEVPDEAFAGKLIGDGLAIRPHESDIMNVFNIINKQGTLQIAKTNHAVIYEINTLELLLHIGIGTVSLKGEGLKIIPDSLPTKADLNTQLIEVDCKLIAGKGLSLITPILSTNPEILSDIKIQQSFGTDVKAGDLIMTMYIA